MAKSSNHAIKGSGGAYCCCCSSPVGEAAKVQPTNCDGDVFCPRCFVWKRMPAETLPLGVDTAGRHPRFQAHQAAACRCQFCGWVVVSFGARPGESNRCSHCGSAGAIRLPIDDASMQALIEGGLKDAQRAAEKA